MTTASIANPAAFNAALTGVMDATNIGSVPVEVMNVHLLAYGPEGSKREPLEPLVRREHTPIEPKSIPGYLESAGEGSSSVFLEGWSKLQRDANWAASFGQNGLQGAASQAASDFAAACVHQAMGDSGGSDASQNRVAARKKYENVAIVYEVEKNFTAAAMVWERAATNPDHVIPERFRKLHRGRAARAWYRSLPRLYAQLDPVSLRLARGIWHAYGNDVEIYRRLLMKSAKFNEYRGRPFDVGADRLRIAVSILSGEVVNKISWNVVSNMIMSAAQLFEGVEGKAIDTQRLIALAAKANGFAEGA